MPTATAIVVNKKKKKRNPRNIVCVLDALHAFVCM
jgi:hypothetical protein